jgi:hypothetical protein
LEQTAVREEFGVDRGEKGLQFVLVIIIISKDFVQEQLSISFFKYDYVLKVCFASLKCHWLSDYYYLHSASLKPNPQEGSSRFAEAAYPS